MILPGAMLGVLGGGQLGRMFTIQARVMGYRVTVLDPDPESPAGALADRHLKTAYDDTAALDELAATCAAVTIEFENVPAAVLERLAGKTIVRPSAAAVAPVQDRIHEKTFLRTHGFATAPFAPIERADQVASAFAEVGAPAILKTSRLGYDGKGQASVATAAETAAAFERFGSVPCILERRLTLDLEISVVIARGGDGSLAAFPPAENEHRNGILHTSVVPARVSQIAAADAVEIAARVAAALGYVGVMAVELFVSEGQLFVNEIAPRPHNSGHYTLDACATDQFEQQVRTLCALPLGDTRLLTPVAMVNILGDSWCAGDPQWGKALALPGVRLHLYGKRTPRPGRKMGHLNCLSTSPDEAIELATKAHAALGPTSLA